MLKLKLQYFGHLIWRSDSLEKTLILGKIEGRRRGDGGWDGWIAVLTQCTWVWASSSSWWWTGKPGMLQSMRSQRVGHDWAPELTNRLNQFDEKVHQLALILHCHFWSTVHKLKPRQPVLLSLNNCCYFWLTSEIGVWHLWPYRSKSLTNTHSSFQPCKLELT